MAASSLNDIAEELRCPVCFEDFSNPKVLNCDHTFCQKCLQQIQKEQCIVCPLCCGKTTIPAGQSVANLREPIIIKQLQNIVAESEKPTRMKSCELCNGNEAAWLCQKCDCCMCEFCKETHETGWTREHSLQRLTTNSFCQDHPLKRVTGYCNSCFKAVCIQCVQTNCCAQNHDIVDLDQVYIQRKKMLKQRKEDTVSVVSTLGPIAASAHLDRQEVNKTYSDTEKQLLEIKYAIRDRFDEEVAHLQQEKRAELKKIAIFESELENERTCCESMLSYVDEVLTKDVPVEVVLSAQNLRKQTTLSALRPKPRIPKPIRWTVADTSAIFENLLTYDVGMPKALKNRTTTSVAAFGTGVGSKACRRSFSSFGSTLYNNPNKLWECTYDEKDLVIDFTYDTKLKELWIRKDAAGRKMLLKYSRDGIFNEEVGPFAKGDGMQRGLAIDTKRDLFITTDTKEIIALRRNGQEFRRYHLQEDATGIVYCGEMDWYVAAGDDKLFCFDAERQVLVNTLIIPQNLSDMIPNETGPRSVVTVKSDKKLIFVTNQWAGCNVDKPKISILQKGGALNKRLGKTLNYPRGMCTYGGSHLLVCDTDNVQVVKFDLKLHNDDGRVILSAEQLDHCPPLAISVAEDQTIFVLVADQTDNQVSYGSRLIAFSKKILCSWKI